MPLGEERKIGSRHSLPSRPAVASTNTPLRECNRCRAPTAQVVFVNPLDVFLNPSLTMTRPVCVHPNRSGIGVVMSTVKQQAMRLIGRSYMAFVLTPDAPIVDWLATVDTWLERSPGFFSERSIVLDLTNVTLSRSGIKHLISSLLERGVRVMGLEGADTSELGPELPPLLRSGRVAGEATEIVLKADSEQAG